MWSMWKECEIYKSLLYHKLVSGCCYFIAYRLTTLAGVIIITKELHVVAASNAYSEY